MVTQKKARLVMFISPSRMRSTVGILLRHTAEYWSIRILRVLKKCSFSTADFDAHDLDGVQRRLHQRHVQM